MGRVASVRGRARRLERLVDRSVTKRNGVCPLHATPLGGAARARAVDASRRISTSQTVRAFRERCERHPRTPSTGSEKALR
jgi:hypothetical protein